MKNPPFNSLVWGSLRLAPIIYTFVVEGWLVYTVSESLMSNAVVGYSIVNF